MQQRAASVVKLFNKLVRLHGRGRRTPEARVTETLAQLAENAEGFKNFVGMIERRLAADGKLADQTPDGFDPKSWQALSRAFDESEPLRKLFAEPPLLSEVDPRDVRALVACADLAPDTRTPQAMLYTQDGVCADVIDAVARRKVTAAEQLVAAYLAKILKLYASLPAATFDELSKLAGGPHWHTVLASLEDRDDYTDGPATEAGQLLQEWRRRSDADLADRLAGTPPLSRVPRELFYLAWLWRAVLNEARPSVSGRAADAAPTPAPVDPKLWAAASLKALRANSEVASYLSDVERALAVRVEVVQHLIKTRRAAKLDALFYNWPRAAALALANRASLEDVEEHLARGGAQPAPAFASAEARDLYEMCEADERLRLLLTLRPALTGRELAGYTAAAPPPSVVAAAETAPPPAVAPARPPAAPPAVPPAHAATTPPGGAEPTFETYRVGVLLTPGAPSLAARVVSEHTYLLGLENKDLAHDGGVVDAVELRLSAPRLIAEALSEVGLGAGRDPVPFLERLFSRPDSTHVFRLARAGQAAFAGTINEFGEEAGKLKSFMAEARSGRGARLEIATDAAEIGCLPWEWLALPGAQEPFIAGDSRSLVRSYPRSRGPAARPLNAPLRVLLVAPHLPGETVNVTEGLMLELGEMLRGRRGIEVRTLTGGEASVERLEDALIESPHVVHFEGYVGDSYSGGEQQPFLQLVPTPGVASGNIAAQLLLPRLREMLDKAGVRLLVVGSCPYPFPVNGIPHPVLRLVEGLIKGGLPTVVAPVRSVDETTAFEFTRGLYRHLSDGLSLESAVSRARLNLLGRGGDWTAFALFTDAATLDAGVLPRLAETRPAA